MSNKFITVVGTNHRPIFMYPTDTSTRVGDFSPGAKLEVCGKPKLKDNTTWIPVILMVGIRGFINAEHTTYQEVFANDE